jgi:hypothetical protein
MGKIARIIVIRLVPIKIKDDRIVLGHSSKRQKRIEIRESQSCLLKKN